MAAYRHCRPGTQVRSLPPHLLFLFVFLCCLLCGSAAAADAPQDLVVAAPSGYALRDDVTLLDFMVDSDSEVMPLASVAYTAFGRRYTWDPDTNQVMRISGFSDREWSNFDQGDKYLAGVVLDMALGAQNAIKSVAGDVVVELDKWINIKAAPEISNGVDHTGITVPNLLSVLASNQKSIWDLHNNSEFAYRQIQDYLSFYNLSFGDGLALISRNQLTSWEMQITYLRALDGVIDISSGSRVSTTTLSGMLSVMSSNQYHIDNHLKSWLNEDSSVLTLLSSGQTEQLNGSNITQVTRMGFNGLASLLAGSGGRTIHINTVDPNDPLNMDAGTMELPSLFDFYGYYGETSLRELTKLRFVLASDDDIQFKQDEKPNEDAMKDSFFGDGAGAVKSSDITAAADISGSAQDVFGGAGSAGDIFVAASDSTTYSFFSAAVANDIDSVNAPTAIAEDDSWLEDLPHDEDGFYYNEFLSPEDYLKGR